MTDSTRKWIEAAKILAKDAHAVVRCPERDDGILTVGDAFARGDSSVVERWITCATCGATNAILMRRSTATRRGSAT